MSNLVISVIGLGYVGAPIALAFAKKVKVIGFDIKRERIDELIKGYDRTNEISKEELLATEILYTNDPKDLRAANFHIVTVPTPVDDAKQPDMSLVISASNLIGGQLKKGDIVVYESTVYPGATEEECIPVLEEQSGLKAGVDFKVGYSPERINPGDKEHVFTQITKVVSGQDKESLDKIAEVYGSVVKAGIYKASSIKVAEASKVIENAQRDINIAFVNELSLIFRRMGIDTKSVLEAAGTKWNFLKFYPGLVGGHCIGVDPFYLTYKAETFGYHSEVILSGRRINDGMGEYVAKQVIEVMIQKDIKIKGSTVNLLGLTFKENCPDIRNTKVLDIYNELKRQGVNVVIHDPEAPADEIRKEFGQEGVSWDNLKKNSVTILASPHKSIIQNIKRDKSKLFDADTIFFDVKGIFDSDFVSDVKNYWRL